eukprot:513415-Amphidinium_carterae.1
MGKYGSLIQEMEPQNPLMITYYKVMAQTPRVGSGSSGPQLSGAPSEAEIATASDAQVESYCKNQCTQCSLTSC